MSADGVAGVPADATKDAPGQNGIPPREVDIRRHLIQRRKLEEPLYYADYLGLDAILNSQHPKSAELDVTREASEAASGTSVTSVGTKKAGAYKGAHDEMLFIITHQAYELWFKQILHEIDSVRDIFTTVPIDDSKMGTAVHRLERIREIQTVLIQQINVLETMSPLDFLDFRDFLYPASGFQSVQFRLVENKLGLPTTARMVYGLRGYCTYLNDKDADVVRGSEGEPSLHDLVEAWLERTPFLAMSSASWDWWKYYETAVRHMLDEDERVIRANSHLNPELIEQQVAELNVQRAHFATLFDEEKYEAARAKGDRRFSYRAMQAALLITLYQHEPILHLPYRLLASLVDIDEGFTTWRYKHALMVHRQLGSKVGTGGSSGYHYLRATAERHKIFLDLVNLPTFLIPRAVIPPLPQEVRDQLAFTFRPDIKAEAKAVVLPPHHPATATTEVGVTGVCPYHKTS